MHVLVRCGFLLMASVLLGVCGAIAWLAYKLWSAIAHASEPPADAYVFASILSILVVISTGVILYTVIVLVVGVGRDCVASKTPGFPLGSPLGSSPEPASEPSLEPSLEPLLAAYTEDPTF